MTGAGEARAYVEGGKGAGEPKVELFIGASCGACLAIPFSDPEPSYGSSGDGPLFNNAWDMTGEAINFGHD